MKYKFPQDDFTTGDWMVLNMVRDVSYARGVLIQHGYALQLTVRAGAKQVWRKIAEAVEERRADSEGA